MRLQTVLLLLLALLLTTAAVVVAVAQADQVHSKSVPLTVTPTSSPSLCGVIPVINTQLATEDLDEISEYTQLLQAQGLYTGVVRLDIGGVAAAERVIEGADETIVVASLPTITVPNQRERLLNLGVRQLPEFCQQVVLFEDATVEFLDQRWVQNTMEMLQSYEVVQPFAFVYNRRQGDGTFVSQTGNHGGGVDAEEGDIDLLFSASMGREPGQVFYSAAYGFNLLRNFDMHRGVAVEKLQGYGGAVWAFHRAFLQDVAGIYDRSLHRGRFRLPAFVDCACVGVLYGSWDTYDCIFASVCRPNAP